MLFFKTLAIYVAITIMDLVKYIYVPFIVNRRGIARIYVYNYFIQTGQLKHYIPKLITRNDGYYYLDEFYLPKIDIKLHKYTILCYYLFVWIWLDDTNTSDVVDVDNILENTLDTHRGIEIALKLRNECGSHIHSTVFKKPFRERYSVSLRTQWLDLYYSNNNNLRNKFRYSNEPKSILGVGYIHKTNIPNAGETYQLELWSLAL